MGNARSDDVDYELRRAAWERNLLHPDMETELEWLRAMQSTVVDAGLDHISVRKFCLLFNVVSAGLGVWMLFWSSEATELGLFWIIGFILANVVTLGVYVGLAMSLSSHKALLLKFNERARAIDSKLNGNMAVGSAIDKRIW
jgi:hypothetical protein